MLRDIERVVCEELFLVRNVVCTYNQQEMNFHTSEKHVKSNLKSTKCVSCEKEFPSYYSLQQHRKKDHGMKAKKNE